MASVVVVIAALIIRASVFNKSSARFSAVLKVPGKFAGRNEVHLTGPCCLAGAAGREAALSRLRPFYCAICTLLQCDFVPEAFAVRLGAVCPLHGSMPVPPLQDAPFFQPRYLNDKPVQIWALAAGIQALHFSCQPPKWHFKSCRGNSAAHRHLHSRWCPCAHRDQGS